MTLRKLRWAILAYACFDLFFGGVCGGFLPLTPLAAAQFTTVSGTVTDPNGLPYANGTISATLITSASPTLGGFPYTPPTQPTGLSASGFFVMNLADNTQLSPGGTTWNFLVCSALGTVQPAGGKGPVCFTVTGVTISGASQDISATLNASALALQNASGVGTNPTNGTIPVKSAGVFADSPLSVTAAGTGSDIQYGNGTGTTPTVVGQNSLFLTSTATSSMALEIHNVFANGIKNYVHSDTAFRSPQFNFYRSNGTQALPTASTFTGFELNPQAQINFNGYNGTSYVNGADIIAYTQENWSSGHTGMCIEINTTLPGGSPNQIRMLITCKDSTGAGGGDILMVPDVNWGQHGGPGIHPIEPSGNTPALLIQTGSGLGAFILSNANTVKVGAGGFTTANNTSLQTITGLSWNIPDFAHNYSFHCALAYSQATATAAVAFGIQANTNNPTNIFTTGHMQVTAGPPSTYVDGTLATLATTTATNIVSATPGATGTNYTATLDGMIELGATLNGINIMVSTANGADAVTVLRGSYCSLLP